MFPYWKSVTDAREQIVDALNNVGDALDAANEQEQDESQIVGHQDHPEHPLNDPVGLIEDPTKTSKTDSYRKIHLQDDDILSEKIQGLDPDQRSAFETMIKYGRDIVKCSNKPDNTWPKAPLMFVHGGAGTGKSHLIDVMSQKLEKTFRRSGDSPSHPYILKLAFTGNAAKLINGQTLHSVFHFRFDDKILSMSDKQRDKIRTSLQNLKVIIIDEISLVKSDMLYQLHFRLAREIMQRPDLPFGGVSVVLLGDLLQLKPVLGHFVFQSPNNKELQLAYLMDSLWEKFEVITLKTNHRQGDDKPYAELLNRVRF